MAVRLPRRRTGDPDLDQRLLAVLADAGATEDLDLLFEMLVTVVRMARDGIDRLDLKITNAALKEMRQAFRVFDPFKDVPKVTIFGSARTLPEDPLYRQSRDVAAALARQGWMVVTGAGPGIMAAGSEGAGPGRSIGVRIRLPFEEETNAFVAADTNLVTMKYFFTRKVMLMKESAGFVVLPGGFGTMDETFELLTLLQTGKAAPAPIVLLEVPGGTYWRAWDRFVRDELVAGRLISEQDMALCRITDSVDTAVNEVLGFYRNYHSIRYVKGMLVIRLQAAPTAEELVELNGRFGDICVSGAIEASDPLPAEVADGDHLGLARLVLRFDRMSHGRLRTLLDTLNRLESAPPATVLDPSAARAAGAPPEDGESVGPAALDPDVGAMLTKVAREGDRAVAKAVAHLRAVLEEGRATEDGEG